MNNNDTQPLISQIQHLNSPEDKRKRVIAVGEYCASHKFNNFCNNKVRTTKYNIISWLPKSILMQFQRIANIYFLIIMILNFFYFSPKVMKFKLILSRIQSPW